MKSTIDNIEKIKKIYKEERILFNKRNILNKSISDIRIELKKYISSYYWNFKYNMYELENMFGIPFNQIHLYTNREVFIATCPVCLKKVNYVAESRSQIIEMQTCSNKCQFEHLEIECTKKWGQNEQLNATKHQHNGAIEMKAFMFNPKKEYNEEHGAIVIESDKKIAESLYLEIHKPRNNNYIIKEIELKKGMLIIASGYDHVEIDIIE